MARSIRTTLIALLASLALAGTAQAAGGNYVIEGGSPGAQGNGARGAERQHLRLRPGAGPGQDQDLALRAAQAPARVSSSSTRRSSPTRRSGQRYSAIAVPEALKKQGITSTGG